MPSKKDVIKDLRKILGEEAVEDDDLVVRMYSKDAVYFEGNAIAVVFPTSTSQVSALLSYAYRNDLRIYPQGSASEIVGSSTPAEDGIVISFNRMNKIKQYSTVDMYVTAEPGVRLVEINEFLAKEGYTFPIDPASVKSATVGGAINSGAGGMMGLRYGTMKDAVLGLEVVLPDEKGTVLRLGGRTTKHRVGYDLIRLIVGSEGTLAVVTEATLKIVPLPENTVNIAAFFPSLEDLANAVVELKKRKFNLYITEFLDSYTVEKTVEALKLKIKGKGNMLIVSVDVPVEAADRTLSALKEVMMSNNASSIIEARSLKEAEEKGIFDVRRGYYPASIRIAAEGRKDPRTRPIVYVEDISVPPSKMAECVRKVRELAEKYGIEMTLGGHIGDGNLHPVLWFEEGDEEKKEKVFRFIRDLMQLAIDLGGTVSSEHGIGTTKKEGLIMELEANKSEKALDIMKEIKRIFDPKGILNPGKLW
jgi:glycolate oxidase